MILVDSSVWIDFLRGIETPQTVELKSLLGADQIAIGDLIMTEVLQGCVQPREFDETLRTLSRLNLVTIAGHEIAVEAARNYLRLRSFGITIRKTIDTLIATHCIMNGYALLHNDRDFLPFEKHLGLKSVIPTTDR
ncbi:MAG: type II toxin-antitoxin system VapC family toxin [Pyrinomonadaceae bacterium]